MPFPARRRSSASRGHLTKLFVLIYALDAAHLPAQRGAEIAPPSNNIVVDTLSLDTSHNNSLVERVARFRTFGEP